MNRTLGLKVKPITRFNLMRISDMNRNPELSVAALKLMASSTSWVEALSMLKQLNRSGLCAGIAQSLWQRSLCLAFPSRAEQAQWLPCLQQAQRHQDLLQHLG